MLPLSLLALKVFFDVVILVQDEPDQGERHQDQTSSFYEESLWVGRHHVSTLNPEPVLYKQLEPGDRIIVQRTTVCNHVPDLVELRQYLLHGLLAP